MQHAREHANDTDAERRAYRGIDSVPAALEGVDANVRAQLVLACDRAVLCLDKPRRVARTRPVGTVYAAAREMLLYTRRGKVPPHGLHGCVKHGKGKKQGEEEVPAWAASTGRAVCVCAMVVVLVEVVQRQHGRWASEAGLVKYYLVVRHPMDQLAQLASPPLSSPTSPRDKAQ